MEIDSLIKKMKDIYSFLMNFIDSTDDSDDEFKALIEFLDEQEILQNLEEVRILFQLLSKLTDNYNRTPDFFNELDIIFQYLIKDPPSPISYFIPDYPNYNKRILFFLFDKKYIKPDESFCKSYQKLDSSISFYLYPKVKEFLEEKIQKQIEKEIIVKYQVELPIFEENCQIGENESYICSLIRTDSVEEFISYVNRTNLSLYTKIKPTIFETNSFLINKEPTLIEYATFYGSIQIIQYLKYNNVPLTFSMWYYAVHSNNAELIHFLEENGVKPEKKESLKDVLNESIKCHHNAISNYIKDNLCPQINDQNQFYETFSEGITDSLNFFFYPNDVCSLICKSGDLKRFKLSKLCFQLQNITIHSSVTSIGDSAFYECSSLKKITIPSSLTSIGNSSFEGCSSLTQITIPYSVTSIGDFAFNGCSSLTQIIIPYSVTLIKKGAFRKCSSLAQITIPSSVISICDSAFFGCTSLTQITIPSSIFSIGDSVFFGCSSLKQITIPSSVTSIGNYAFSNCTSLTQITIPSSKILFGEHIFNGITTLKMEGNIQYIPTNLFFECSSLKQITIPSSVTSIRDNAFEGCSSLTKITIYSSVDSIGDYAFYKCSLLTQITIPSSVTKIGKYAFRKCSSLTQITIPSSVKSIGNSVFEGCSSLIKITIPSSVASIGDYAFSGCSSLAQIAIPSSVTKIGNYAFNKCSSLTQITIPSSVKSIGKYAFKDCFSLAQVTIPSSVKSIGKNVFEGCSSLSFKSIQ